jgi:hypothetical protein
VIGRSGIVVAMGAAAMGCGRSGAKGAGVEAVEASVAALHGTACGVEVAEASAGVECAQYGSAVEAFEDALAAGGASGTGETPLVLGMGEVHAPAGAAVASAAKRFTTELLPALDGRASDLLLELMMPPRGCADAVAEARRDQAPVTEQHAASDQDEYVAMGDRARALGIVPDMLRPTCADMDAIKHAGDDLVDVSLSTIARLARDQGGRMIDRDALSDADRGKMVVLYGGSLHNDLDPPAEAARWSYAPALAAQAERQRGRLVAVDLVVPEFIGQAAVWQNLPWWPAYEALASSRARARLLAKVTLFRTGPASFVLLFPSSAPPP